jgi:hypothetical protein
MVKKRRSWGIRRDYDKKKRSWGIRRDYDKKRGGHGE